MKNRVCPGAPLFRVWIAGFTNWVPARWDDVPPCAVALVPAEEGCLPADQARTYLEGFNGRMLAEARPLWAVALPVAVQYEGDAVAGQSVEGHQFSQATAGAMSDVPETAPGSSVAGP